jgi:hypothetical protein
MAVISVPRELREKLGDPATDSLVDLLHQFGDEQRQDLIAVVEERFARHVAESRDTLRSEMHTSHDALRSEMHAGFDALRSEMHTGLDTLRGEMHTGLDTLRGEVHTDLDTLRGEMHTGLDTLRGEVHTDLDTLRGEMHTGLDTLRGEMHTGLDTLRSEMHAGFLDVQKQLLDQQQQLTGMAKEIGSVRADLRKEITVQTRWLLTVLVAATILIPVMQRVLGAVFP